MAHVHGAVAKKVVDHAAMGHSIHGASKLTHAAVAAGTTAIAVSSTKGTGFMSIFAKHPLLVFGAGVAVGFYAHKYRKEIIESASQVTELSKDFILHQKENLEDLVAETQEAADDAGSAKPAKGRAK